MTERPWESLWSEKVRSPEEWLGGIELSYPKAPWRILWIALGLGVVARLATGPTMAHHRVNVAYHPGWIPSGFASIIPGLPHAWLPIPPGSTLSWGQVPSVFGSSLTQDLWDGSVTMEWPLTVSQSMSWGRSHIRRPWLLSGSGSFTGPHQSTVDSLLFVGSFPYQTLTASFIPIQGWTRVSFQIQRVMLPARPASSVLMPHATQIRMIYQETARKKKSIVIRSSTVINPMLHQLNRLTEAPQGVGGCEAQIPGVITFQFIYPRIRPITATYSPACGSIRINHSPPLRVNSRLLGLWQKLLAPSPLG